MVQDAVVRKEVLDDVVTRFQSHTACNFAAFGSVCILLSIEQWEEMHLPSNDTTQLNYFFHRLELYSIVRLCPMEFELFLCFEGLATFRTRHLEGRLKLDVLVSVNLHLLLMVTCILLLTDLVFNRFAMPLKELLAHKTLGASTALVAPLALDTVVRAQT